MSKKKSDWSRISDYSWISVLVSAIGFAYIAIGEKLQQSLLNFVSPSIKSHMLEYFSKDEWMLILLSLTVLFAFWGGIAPQIATHVLKIRLRDNNELLKVSQSECDTLRDDNQKLRLKFEDSIIDTYGLFSLYLCNIYRNLELTQNERISIYRIELGSFRCIGRYSLNEQYKEKPERMYSRDYGYLGRAWNTGSIQDTNSPCPDSDFENYVQYHHDQYGVPREIIEKSAMKSRAFRGIRIQNTQRSEPLAVVVCESKNVNGLPFGKISRAFNDLERRKLASLLEGLSNHMASVELAHGEGF